MLACHLLMAAPFVGYSQSEIVMTIGGQQITKEEFVRLYRKNNENLINDSLRKSPEEYLDLFVNYKLKVLEAKNKGMDTLSSFTAEFGKYRNQLAKNYLNYNEITEEDMRSAYQRMCSEVKAAHILIRLAPDAQPEQDSAIYRKCMDIRNQILQGSDFETVATQYSEDPSVSRNQGMLGYFSAFQMVSEFEDAAFNLQPGDLSMPIRTKYGYHIIKVYDKRPNPGEIQVAHIMKRLLPNAGTAQIQAATNELDSIRNLLMRGEDFASLASMYSDDRNSAQNGGALPYFSTSGILPEFSDAAFSLSADGEISSVVRTPAGLHLIKRINIKPVDTYEKLKPFIQERLRNNPLITKQKQQKFIEQLLETYSARPDNEVLNLLAAQAKEPSILTGESELPMHAQNEIILTIDNDHFQTNEFIELFNQQLRKATNKERISIAELFKSFSDDKLIWLENQNLEKKYPDFKYLTQEYHDGILLFNLTEEIVWKKAVQDSTGLVTFYEQNKELFKWDSRFDGWAIQCENQEVRDYIDQIFEQSSELDATELRDLLDSRFPNQSFIQKGIFARGQNPLVDYFVWNAAKPQSYVEGLHFVRGNLVPPAAKTLEEARGQYISAYQDQLEKNWIENLRKKYKVKLNKKVFNTIESVE